MAKEKCTFLPFYLEPELEPIKTECILSTPITEMNFNGVVKTTVLPVYSHIWNNSATGSSRSLAFCLSFWWKPVAACGLSNPWVAISPSGPPLTMHWRGDGRNPFHLARVVPVHSSPRGSARESGWWLQGPLATCKMPHLAHQRHILESMLERALPSHLSQYEQNGCFFFCPIFPLKVLGQSSAYSEF